MEYDTLFEVRDDTVYLDENVTVDDLDRVLDLIDCPYNTVAKEAIMYNSKIKDAMGLNKVKYLYKSKLFFEALLFSYYAKFATGDGKNDYKTLIRTFLDNRNTFYMKLLANKKDTVADFDSENELYEQDELYPNYPLSKDIDYDEIFKDSDISVNDILISPYMVTIFDENSKPLKARINRDCATLAGKYFEDETFENDTEYKRFIYPKIAAERLMCNKINFTPRVWEEKLFYLEYIKHLDELIDKYGENTDLLLTKYKLIYLLDDASTPLLDNNNLEKEYDRLCQRYYNGDESKTKIENLIPYPLDYYWYQVFALACIIDLFENELFDQELIYKKLAMIKTYYALTNDEEVIKVFNDYRNHPNYIEYYSFIKDVKNKTLKK